MSRFRLTRTRVRWRGAAAAAGVLTLLGLVLSGCSSSTGLTAPRLQDSLGRTFANLYVLQQHDQGDPAPAPASLKASTSCQKGGTLTVPQDGSGVWLCSITYLVAGPGYPVIAKYNVDVQTDGCYAADGDGPASVNGSPTVTGPHNTQLDNPLNLIDGCFNTT